MSRKILATVTLRRDKRLVITARRPAPMLAKPLVALLRVLAIVAAWFWTLLGGVGGFLLLLRLGPLPLTNGWFAMFSGVLACPLLPRFVESAFRLRVRWTTLLAASAAIMLAGRIAVALYPPPPPRPTTNKVWNWKFLE
jgi:hypothetical protein